MEAPLQMNRKVFISYSWTTPAHEQWVLALAERLMADGIEVVIDKWDLKEGHDLYDFMESMVKSEGIHKVLIILDKKYSEKADARSGGVGTETQIISPKIYKDTSQEKFIPIVVERDNLGNAFLPTFLEGRVYIDMSNNDQFEKNYESLIRNIYDRPLYSKPKVGAAPKYLFEETPMNFKTSFLLRSFDSHYDRHPNRLNSMIREFLDEFYINLKAFGITFETHDHIGVGKAICDSVNQYTPLRDDYITFVDKLTKLGVEFDFDVMVRFFENLTLLTAPGDGRGSWTNHEFDNFRLFIRELFLYTVAVAMKNECYWLVENALHSGYFTKDSRNYRNDAKSFDAFNYHVDVIDKYYKDTFSQNFFSPMADLMIKRLPETVSKSQLVQADLLCHYVAELKDVYWFPMTYIYDSSGKSEIFYKLVSKRHFEKVKGVFGFDTVEEFKAKLIKMKAEESSSNRIRYSGSFDSVSPLYSVVEIESLATVR
ncbi:TIR domain-containing protein [Rufibacter immobilis]|uniref:TIR domain-containing protein n=1 Tax=Rufibacter immobilis TaxID=1348778 RepID=A0A3M9MR67_9BACT|nr:toll/interleukin-1 receptor domain-containing protein [Rufibacter immobilis]RNI27373.1 TIR domain-containing protein [Rufibacter immobilis]